MAVSKTRRTRILGAATAFIGVGAAGLMMAAPASAAVTDLSWDGPSGYGSSEGIRGSSCAYGVTAKAANDGGAVKFQVTKDGTAGDVETVDPSNGKAEYVFKPAAPGEYKIEAWQAASKPANPYSLSTDVATGINLDVLPDTGSLEIVTPLQADCLVIG